MPVPAAGTWELGHKGHLYRNVAAACRRVRGSDAFDIVPRAYLMPRDYEDFKQDLARHPGRLYIQKVGEPGPGRARCQSLLAGVSWHLLDRMQSA